MIYDYAIKFSGKEYLDRVVHRYEQIPHVKGAIAAHGAVLEVKDHTLELLEGIITKCRIRARIKKLKH